MKVLDIAFKDMLRSFRSMFAIGMMVVVPLLITGLIYFAFSGLMTSGSSPDLADERVALVNLDSPVQGNNFGAVLVTALQDPKMPAWLKISTLPDEETARLAMQNKQVDMVVVVPASFTGAALNDQPAELTVLADPAQTLMPGIVVGILNRYLDGLNGAQIAVRVSGDQLAQLGSALDGQAAQQIASAYAAWYTTQMQDGSHLMTVTTAFKDPAANSIMADMMALIMAGMAIFFGYYTAAYTATTILKEQEEGTLARLFTTPTSKATILGGKFLAVFITCGIQLPVLLVLSALLFKIHWGNPVLLAVTVFSQVVAASGFGVFIISFVKNTRQSGAVLGGLLTVLGMLGGLFTTMVQGLPQVFQVINLLTPHGWALKSWRLVLGGAGLPDLVLPSLVLLAIGAVTFGAGVLRFRRRLA